MILAAMESAAIESLVQLGFAVACASWLIYWLTRTMKGSVDTLTRMVASLHLLIVDLYKLLVQHDAQIRGINPSAGKDADERHQNAVEAYERVLSQLEALTAQLERCLEGGSGK